MRVRNIAVGAGLAPWLSDRLDSICRAGFEEDPSSNSCKRFFSHLMSSLCFACSFAFAFGFSSMISHSCEYFSKRVCKPSKRCPCSSRLEQVNWASCCSDVCKVAEPGIIWVSWMGCGCLTTGLARDSTPARRTRAWSKCLPTSTKRILFAIRLESSKSHTRDELLLGWCHGRTKYIATTTVVPRGPRNQMAWSNYLSQNGYGAASKVLWFHWVLAQVLDTLKVCNPFVHKLSWTSTWDWQHFGNHLSCPCATCALNLAWFDCHCYRRGMNRCRSPRVFISLLLLYYWW